MERNNTPPPPIRLRYTFSSLAAAGVARPRPREHGGRVLRQREGADVGAPGVLPEVRGGGVHGPGRVPASVGKARPGAGTRAGKRVGRKEGRVNEMS